MDVLIAGVFVILGAILTPLVTHLLLKDKTNCIVLILAVVVGLFGGLILGNYASSAFLADSRNSSSSNNFQQAPFISPVTNTGSGCQCANGCNGIMVSAGSQIPSTSILEPFSGQRGTLYIYVISGQAAVSGMVWTYTNSSGGPASKSCLEAQYQFFSYNELVIVD